MYRDGAVTINVQGDDFNWISCKIGANVQYAPGGVIINRSRVQTPFDGVFHVGIGYSMLPCTGVDDQHQMPINVVRKYPDDKG
ncbi:unannotated protein [freshwater metagenome]|uniref:Unannotated protein n=1 Tax=freshwater metagenome TaxID=449393 RepID=A0A6J6J4E3_9ZZZZ|nr:hypothetical protein [Actinomycetota bacterium]